MFDSEQLATGSTNVHGRAYLALSKPGVGGSWVVLTSGLRKDYNKLLQPYNQLFVSYNQFSVSYNEIRKDHNQLLQPYNQLSVSYNS